jgi:HEAT repeat protein
VIEALREISGNKAVTILLQALEDVYLTNSAAEALGEIGAQEGVPPLYQVLTDKDCKKKLHDAAISDYGFKSQQNKGSIRQTLRNTATRLIIHFSFLFPVCKHARKAAAEAMAKIGNPEAIKLLKQALQHDNKWVREAATGALGGVEDSQVVTELICMLEDNHKGVCWEAAKALGKMGVPEATPHLIRKLNSMKPKIRREAAAILGELSRNINDERTVRKIAHRIWWRLTDKNRSGIIVDYSTYPIWNELSRVVARLTELEVEALDGGPPLFDPPT